MRRLAAAAFAVALLAPPAVARADAFSAVSVGVHAGTTGAGVTLEKPLLYNFSVRIETNWLTVAQQMRYDAQSYASTSHFRNAGVIADFRPYGGRYRLSAGLLFGSDEIDNVAQPSGSTIQVGSGVYSGAAAGSVTSRVRFDRPSIYLGAGTGTGIIPGLALSVDGGILIRNGHASASANGPLQNDPGFEANLNRLAGELRTHVVSPVFSVGLVYRP
ncbi:MAG TPA: hypothetical protein VFB22_04445 [Candidatus Baltobacteraceae bacterium]|nr:hypothetical protein [Candidatus Baltobacteraceae bacterium]